jgi:ribose-phosphate pyrophosphokinase
MGSRSRYTNIYTRQRIPLWIITKIKNFIMSDQKNAFRILNLVTPEHGSIQYSISRFPDGQQALDITNPGHVSGTTVWIYARLNTFADLEIIVCANQALKEAGAKEVSLYVPYFIGARSDRKFREGSVNYLKAVICPLINSQNFAKVKVVDPHSDVLEACLNNYEKVSNLELVKWALPKIDNTNEAREKVVLVSPDAGALKKVYDVAENLRIDKIVIAAKHRDINSGRITHTDVPGLDAYRTDSTFVIIDDICDGGRTFIEIAKAITSKVWPRDEYFRGKIYLIVSHGIFSSGFLELEEYVDGIFCTDSYSTIRIEPSSEEGKCVAFTPKGQQIINTGLINQLGLF